MHVLAIHEDSAVYGGDAGNGGRVRAAGDEARRRFPARVCAVFGHCNGYLRRADLFLVRVGFRVEGTGDARAD